MPLKAMIAEVINGRDLTMAQAETAMNIIMQGEATPAQIGSYLTALRMKGETVAEIAGSASSMRAHVVSVAVEPSSNGMLVDTCGTGGMGNILLIFLQRPLLWLLGLESKSPSMAIGRLVVNLVLLMC